MLNEILDEEWDLGDVLAERKQPETHVTIYLNEMASYAKSELEFELSKTENAVDAEKIEAAIAEVDAELEKSRYTIYMAAIPSRMREDIASKAMAKIPFKLDFAGRDDVVNATARMKYQNDLTWTMQIRNVVNPEGKSRRVWTEWQMQAFSESLPTPAQAAIDAAIKEINAKAEQYVVKSKSVDF